MGTREEVLRVFPLALRSCLQSAVEDFSMLEEIRLRGGQPVFLRYAGEEWFLTEGGGRIRSRSSEGRSILERGQAYALKKELLPEMLTYLCNYSVYAVEEQLKQGYLTIAGGHRVGICGEMLPDSGGGFRMHRIGSMNLRVAHEHRGCGQGVLECYDLRNNPGSLVLLSPPGGGKTTLLRDIIRGLSEGGYTVGVVDERSEIAACYEGIPQNALGPRTDVLDACGKREGLRMLLRTMAPEYLALDEVSGAEDVAAVREAMGRGCHMLVTCHAGNKQELLGQKEWRELLEQGRFRGIVTIFRESGGRRRMRMEAANVD